jgi:hypothetical protein
MEQKEAKDSSVSVGRLHHQRGVEGKDSRILKWSLADIAKRHEVEKLRTKEPRR